MNSKDDYQILDVHPSATPAEVRASYRNLAQVWHPDRFAGNPKLQQMAEAKMREINAAYERLVRRPQPEPNPGFDPPPPGPTPQRNHSPEATWSPPSRGNWRQRGIRLGFASQVATTVLTIIFGWWLFSTAGRLLRVDALAGIGAGGPASPVALLNPTDDLRSAARLLNDWAQFHMDQGGIPVSGVGAIQQNNQPPARTQAGSETTRQSSRRQVFHRKSLGAGEITVTNETSLDAVAELIPQPGRQAEPIGIFVPAGGSATGKGISVGVYDLVVRSGAGYRLGQFKTLKETRLLAPLQFLEVHSESGTQGDNYVVILRPE